jgi:hypothetical protein
MRDALTNEVPTNDTDKLAEILTTVLNVQESQHRQEDSRETLNNDLRQVKTFLLRHSASYGCLERHPCDHASRLSRYLRSSPSAGTQE